MSSLIYTIFTNVNVFFLEALGSSFAVCRKVQYTAQADNGAQGNDFVQWDPKYLQGNHNIQILEIIKPNYNGKINCE